MLLRNLKGFKDTRFLSIYPMEMENLFFYFELERPGVIVEHMEEEAILKQVVPPEEDPEHKDEETSGRGRDSLLPPLSIGGQGIMHRVFPNIMSFIAHHLSTTFTSPTEQEQ